MSTAVMPQNAMYEFGDIIIKNGASDAAPGSHMGTNAMRLTLSRMASTPAGSANLAALLGNLTHRRLERTQSAPAPAAAAAAATMATSPTTVNTSRYKTELCRPYEEFGVCKYGDKCQFAHGVQELRSLARHPKYKTELCRTYHTVGFCPYGPRCHFVHNQDEVLQQNHHHHHHHRGGPVSPAAAAAALLQQQRVQPRPRPAALSPALSLDSGSPACSSLSQSPTTSLCSFFCSEPELHSPTATAAAATTPTVEEQRLPVFNRLSAPLLTFSDLLMQ